MSRGPGETEPATAPEPEPTLGGWIVDLRVAGVRAPRVGARIEAAVHIVATREVA
ncbi:hypothetical protein N4P33_16280 [Streptomyces sp. 15-116A]|uniref:hypothetical protein n=1 Tax=Streptomyces sp. 15-116A TaxID=2259035 RepID=UPI0021B3F9D1|nr:hypothetical protein [Streptomyces sp. 15-116A]MCT7353715.1 hypothetical protein [Streptomyces sp. 15-116A]